MNVKLNVIFLTLAVGFSASANMYKVLEDPYTEIQNGPQQFVCRYMGGLMTPTGPQLSFQLSLFKVLSKDQILIKAENILYGYGAKVGSLDLGATEVLGRAMSLAKDWKSQPLVDQFNGKPTVAEGDVDRKKRLTITWDPTTKMVMSHYKDTRIVELKDKNCGPPPAKWCANREITREDYMFICDLQ